MALQKRGKALRSAGTSVKTTVGTIRSQARVFVRSIPGPRSWPGWIHFLHQIGLFLAGMGAVLLWMAAPWLAVSIAIILVALFIFVR